MRCRDCGGGDGKLVECRNCKATVCVRCAGDYHSAPSRPGCTSVVSGVLLKTASPDQRDWYEF